MTKYVIDTVELKKRKYVIEAYSEKEALELLNDAEPVTQEVLSDTIFDIHSINEYEYKHTPDYHEGHDLFKDPDIGPDQLKDQEVYQYDAFKDQDLFRDD